MIRVAKQVFVAGSLVGGADDVLAALADGSLKDRVAAAADTLPLPSELQALLTSAETSSAGGTVGASSGAAASLREVRVTLLNLI